MIKTLAMQARGVRRTTLAGVAGVAVASVLFVGAGSGVAHAEPRLDGAPGQPIGRTVSVSLGATSRNLSLPKGKSAVIELPVDARDVMVSDPKVADVVLSTPRRIYVLGQAAGSSDATFLDGMGRQILRLNIRVDSDTSALAETLDHVLPGASVHVEAVNDRIILSGEVPNPADADKAVRVATAFVDKPENVINMLAVAAPEQVMLKVRIVEVNRQVLKQLGVSLNALLTQVDNRISKLSILDAATYGVNGAALGGVTSAFTTGDKSGSSGAEGVLQAFEQNSLVRTLAEPNLTTVSGESAKFLAGGEFPVPVGQALGVVSVEFKSFGVGLGFTPVVLSDGRISLKLSTEYSEISSQNSYSQTLAGASTSSSSTTSSSTAGATSNSNGATSFTIPSLTVRRAETVVEMPSGGSMMIAGLLESVNKQSISALPGLTQLPVLGALFRSRDYLQGETELVVIVTPYLVKAVRPDQIQTPADGLQIADDPRAYLLGRLNQGFDKQPNPLPGKTYQGPFGYVVQ